jgi:hypothetical protein
VYDQECSVQSEEEALLHLRQVLRFLLLICMEAAGERSK